MKEEELGCIGKWMICKGLGSGCEKDIAGITSRNSAGLPVPPVMGPTKEMQ